MHRSITILLVFLALIMAAEAQGPRYPLARPGLTFSASDGYLWPVDPARSPAGRLYFAVRVTIARDGTAPDQPLTVFTSSFRFTSREGLTFTPRYGPPFGSPPLEAPCQSLPLTASSAVTCDILFEVPDYVLTGTLDFLQYGMPPQTRPIVIRQ